MEAPVPMQMLKLRPGVNSELTLSQNEAGYSISNLIRYRNGLAEKLGGWTSYYSASLGSTPKALHAWLDLNENEYLAVGATGILGSINNSLLTDITPQTLTSNFNDTAFDTTNTSPNVVVDDPNIANVTNYDAAEFLTPISVGGIILSGVYPIDASLGTTTYRIIAATNATATVTNQGTVPEFTSASGSQLVTVTFPNHGLSVGGKINFPISTAFAGVTITGTYTAQTVPTANTFTIGVNALATSSTSTFMNSGDCRIRYHIALGPAATSTGYSVGTYSSGSYSTGTAVTAQTGTAITSTDWSLDNWGEILLANPEGGGIYQWQPNTGFQNAKLLSADSAPAYNNGMFVSMQTQMLICYGSSEDLTQLALGGIGLDQDPLLVKWSDQTDYTSFTPGVTSFAGSRRLSTGSKIVGGMSSSNQELIWTDLGLWSMNFLDSLQAGVWGFIQVGWSCGLIGKHAAARLGANVYWIASSKNFFALVGGGAPQIIPCTVWDAVFQDINRDYQHKCFAWPNTPFAEVWFFWPRASTSATEPDAYVKYNVAEGEWDSTVNTIDRSCGIDQSIVGGPLSATSTGIVYEHETSPNADGQPINSYFETGYFQINEGNDVGFVDWILPDMKFGNYNASPSAVLSITFTSTYYPGGPTQTHGPYTFTSTTQYINTRIRGRLMSMKVESNDLGSWWRCGGLRYRWAPDGRL